MGGERGAICTLSSLIVQRKAAWNTPDTASPRPSPKGEGEQLAGYPGVFERTEWEKGASPQPSPKGEGEQLARFPGVFKEA